MLPLLLALTACGRDPGLTLVIERRESLSLQGRLDERGIPLRMVLIPKGDFEMNLLPPAPERPKAERGHAVRLSRPFLLGATEVTQGLYLEVMGQSPSARKSCPNCPVEGLSWYDAVRFCNLLSAREGLRPAYEISGETVLWRQGSRGYRLPTEAEWEYAAVWTQSANEAWYAENSRSTTHAVGLLAPNGFGVYDMLGNAREWVWDGYAPFDGAAALDPVGPDRALLRGVRGGAWDNLQKDVSATLRDAIEPSYRDEAQGFRVAASLVSL